MHTNPDREPVSYTAPHDPTAGVTHRCKRPNERQETVVTDKLLPKSLK